MPERPGERAAQDRDHELSFKEMCARFDVTPRTLRYYEYIELLQPRRDGRARFYGAREVARMTLILRGRRFGFSLEEIRQWLQMREEAGTEAQMRAFVAMADAQLKALEEQREQIGETMEELRRLREVARAGAGAGCARAEPDAEPGADTGSDTGTEARRDAGAA